MSRTTDEAVRGIIEFDEDIDADPFILAASSMVDDHCTDSDYSDAKLEIIERWLAAHFVAILVKQVTGERAAVVSQNFALPVSLKLDGTTYGQQAMLLDSDGNLAAHNERLKKGEGKVPDIDLDWLGTER